MIAKHFLTINFLLLFLNAFSQIETPPRKSFNIGLFTGLGGANVTPIPALDIRFKGSNLRLAPGYRYNGAGIVQEIIPFSKTFYNAYWIVSVFYIEGSEDIHANVKTNYKSYAGLAGLKYYMGRHFFTEFQLGAIYTEKNTIGFNDKDAVSPYFEFGLGFNIFKNYPRKILEEED